MKKQDTKPVKLEKEYNQYDLTDVFMRGLFYGEMLAHYKQDSKINNKDNKLFYDYILEMMKNKQSIIDIINLPLEMFILLYREVTDKTE